MPFSADLGDGDEPESTDITPLSVRKYNTSFSNQSFTKIFTYTGLIWSSKNK